MTNHNERPANHGKSWSHTDDLVLIQMVQHGCSNEQIATALERTPATIGWRIHHLRTEKNVSFANRKFSDMNHLIQDQTNDETEQLGSEFAVTPNGKKPIERIEYSTLFGLIKITRFKYADD